LARGDNDFDIARNRIAAAQVYIEAVSPFTADDVEGAVQAFLTGGVPGFNAAFAPTAPQVGSVCRREMEKRLESAERSRRFMPRLPPPDIPKTDDSRKRVREAMKHAAETIGAVNLDTTEAEMAASKERWARVNAHFDPPQDYESLTDRLNLNRDSRGYDIGAPEEENAA
jgi:hypothetical protein